MSERESKQSSRHDRLFQLALQGHRAHVATIKHSQPKPVSVTSEDLTRLQSAAKKSLRAQE